MKKYIKEPLLIVGIVLFIAALVVLIIASVVDVGTGYCYSGNLTACAWGTVWIVALIVLVFSILLAAVGIVLVKRAEQKSAAQSKPPDEPAEEP